MAPQTTGVAIAVRIPPDELADLDKQAAASGIPRAELIRQYVRDGLMRDARRAKRRATA